MLILADLRHKKTFIISIRASSAVYAIGMFFISCFLGLFTIWSILYICIVGAIHAFVFIKSLSLPNDVAPINRNYRLLHGNGNNSSASNAVPLRNRGNNDNEVGLLAGDRLSEIGSQVPANAGPQRTELYEQLRQQRA